MKEQPEDLTAGTRWQWRTERPGGGSPWCDSLAEAIAGDNLPYERLAEWPAQWQVFYTAEARRELRAGGSKNALPPPPAHMLTRIPEQLVIADQALLHKVVAQADTGVVDLAASLGACFDGRTAFAFAPLELSAPQQLTIYVGADYWMRWWVDGQPVFDTLEGGNRGALLERAHEFPLELAAGTHVLVAQIISGSGGWGFASEATRRTQKPDSADFGLTARRVFEVQAPEHYASLTFDGGDRLGVRLNAHPLPLPLLGMHYQTIPGISPKLLHPGTNVLCKAWPPEEVAPVQALLPLEVFRGTALGEKPWVGGGLQAWKLDQVTIQTGAVLGWAALDRLTLALRTQIPAELTLSLGGQRLLSPRGLIHQFEVSGLSPGTSYAYELAAMLNGAPKRIGGGEARTLPATGSLRIAVLGDVYPFDDTWERIAAKVLETSPDLVLFSGDMVLDGREDVQWDSGFFGPARELLQSVPFYAVLGNHENDSPLFHQLFMTPGGRNWSQECGPVLLVGLDGALDWTGGEHNQWLEQVLVASDAPFKFVVSHYPPFSSGGHGRLGPDGAPREATVRQARQYLVPLLERHRVRALFSGHDHFYERSELPGGLTAIVSAGAGSRLYRRSQDLQQNPYSTVSASQYHFCLLEVSSRECVLKATSINGEILDEVTWPADSGAVHDECGEVGHIVGIHSTE